MKRNNAGFTLIEVLVSIVVLGLIVVPVCSGLVLATRINAKAESMLEAKLAVSSAVETMMAEGIDITKDVDTAYDTDAVNVTAFPTKNADGETVYYTVEAVSKAVESVAVKTTIRAVDSSAGGGTG